MKITFNTKELATLLSSIAKIKDSVCLELNVDESTVKTTVVSESRDINMLSSVDVTIEVDEDEDEDDIQDTDLNLPSVTKLIKAIKVVKSEEITFGVHENHLTYIGDEFRFKYHILDDGIIAKEHKNLSKLMSMEWDVNFRMSSDTLKSIINYSKIFKDTSKIYIQANDDIISYQLTDKTRKNVDSAQIEGGEYEGLMNFEFITDMSIFNKFVTPNKIELEFGMSENFCKICVVGGGIDIVYALASEAN